MRANSETSGKFNGGISRTFFRNDRDLISGQRVAVKFRFKAISSNYISHEDDEHSSHDRNIGEIENTRSDKTKIYVYEVSNRSVDIAIINVSDSPSDNETQCNPCTLRKAALHKKEIHSNQESEKRYEHEYYKFYRYSKIITKAKECTGIFYAGEHNMITEKAELLIEGNCRADVVLRDLITANAANKHKKNS